MNSLRLLFRDRVSASAIVALVALFLVLQGLLGGVAHGAMAGAAADPFNILCATNDDGGPAHRAPVDSQHGDPGLCATLCQWAALGLSVPASGPSVHTASVPPAKETGRRVGADGVYHATPRGLLAEARAPPAISI